MVALTLLCSKRNRTVEAAFSADDALERLLPLVCTGGDCRCLEFWDSALEAGNNRPEHQYSRHRISRELRSHQEREARLRDACPPPQWETAVERRSATEMSVAEFREVYARKRRPVIITGVLPAIEPKGQEQPRATRSLPYDVMLSNSVPPQASRAQCTMSPGRWTG